MKAIKNISIYTGGEKPKFIKEGVIVWNKDKIIKIVENGFDENSFNGEIVDGKNKLLIPGLIIAHDHLYSALARGIKIKSNNPRNFYEILNKIWWKLDLALNQESVYYSALVGLIDAVRSGVTTIIDHHASFGYILGSLDEIERASTEIGIRLSTCFEVSDRWGEEKAKESIKENLRFIEKNIYRKDGMIVPTFGLHALFTIGEKTLKECSEIGNHFKVAFHIHLAEDRFDRDYNLKLYNLSPVERLLKENMLNEKTLLIHSVHVDRNDLEMIKENNSIVIHNPESNMNNAVGLPDIFELLKKGILVGLGTDGFTQDIIREAQVLYVAHKHNQLDSNVGFSESNKIVFLNNPKIVERTFSYKIGVIEEDAKADFVLLDYIPPTPLDQDNFFGHFIFGLSSRFVSDVIINGDFILKDRVFTKVDEKKVLKESQEIAKNLWGRFDLL